MILYVWPSVSGLTDKIILPGLPAVHDGLFHLWIGRSDTAFRLRLKGTAEKEIICEPVKAPLWHKHKRNGPCIISLNCCLGVRAKPFSPLMRQSAYVRSKSFWAMVYRRIKPLLRKNLMNEGIKKSGSLYQNLELNSYFCIRRVLWRLRNAQKDNAVDN